MPSDKYQEDWNSRLRRSGTPACRQVTLENCVYSGQCGGIIYIETPALRLRIIRTHSQTPTTLQPRHRLQANGISAKNVGAREGPPSHAETVDCRVSHPLLWASQRLCGPNWPPVRHAYEGTSECCQATGRECPSGSSLSRTRPRVCLGQGFSSWKWLNEKNSEFIEADVC